MKIKILLSSAIVLIVAGAAQAQKMPVYKPSRAEIVNAAEFAPLSVKKKLAPCRKSLSQCAFEAMAEVGLEGFGGPEEIHFFEHQFTYRQAGKSIGVFLFSILDREENPAHDERTRVEFTRDKNAWRFVRIGQQTRCVNGKKITKWSKSACR